MIILRVCNRCSVAFLVILAMAGMAASCSKRQHDMDKLKFMDRLCGMQKDFDDNYGFIRTHDGDKLYVVLKLCRQTLEMAPQEDLAYLKYRINSVVPTYINNPDELTSWEVLGDYLMKKLDMVVAAQERMRSKD